MNLPVPASIIGFGVGLACCGLPGFGQTVTTTPTFNNLGVEIHLLVPATQSFARVFLKPSGTPLSAYREGHRLAPLSATLLAGSVFGLTPGTSYDLKLTSPDFAADLFVSATTRSDVFPDATNLVYHVSPVNGDDNNDGTSLLRAFKTIAKALAVAGAGAKTLLHDGIYYEGDLSAPRSGTPLAPIVIENASGARPIMSGIDPSFNAVWTLFDATNHVYRAPCAATPEDAFLNGGQFFHYHVLADLLSQPWNQPSGYFVDGSFLYARFASNAPPGTNIVTIPAHTTALTISEQSNLQIRGLEFCYYGLNLFHRAIYLDGGDSNLVERCFFHHNGVGVALKRASDFNTIQNCVFTEFPIATWSWHAVKDSGTDYEAGGVLVYGSSTPSRGNVIRFCTFTNMFDGAHLYSDVAAGPTQDLDFHDNLIQGCVDDGIETDGAGSNCRIYFNRFQDVLTGVSVAPCAIGPTYIFRNILTDWRSSEEFDGYPFKFNVSSSLQTQWVYLYHNSCFSTVPSQHGFWLKQYSNWTNVVSRNNIFAGTSLALESQDNVTNTFDLDYDDFFTSSPAPVIKWSGERYSSLSEFALATGEERHGVWSQPGFVNAAAQDYYLPPQSPLIDKGSVISGINDDYVGVAPDLGAIESGMEVKNISVDVTGVAVAWHVGVHGKYQLEASTALSGVPWQPVGEPVQAESAFIQFNDPSLADTRFYRLQHLAPWSP